MMGVVASLHRGLLGEAEGRRCWEVTRPRGFSGLDRRITWKGRHRSPPWPPGTDHPPGHQDLTSMYTWQYLSSKALPSPATLLTPTRTPTSSSYLAHAQHPLLSHLTPSSPGVLVYGHVRQGGAVSI